jgi:DNA-binding NarL/FixJ family response regulator
MRMLLSVVIAIANSIVGPRGQESPFILDHSRLLRIRERPISVSAEKLRVVLVDDHAFYRHGLADLLERSDIDVVGEASNGLAAVETVEHTAPDVVVMDLNMPRLSGVETTRRLTERSPSTRVLVLSVSAEEADVLDAILAGASGYLLKDGPVEDVAAGIRAAAEGESLISPKIATMLMTKVRERQRGDGEAPQPQASLSERELEVLDLVAQGKANPEIAERLFIGETTVRNHISSILAKLQVENRVQAAVRAVQDRMV